jgi:nicotinate-nucleotide adenylyltransferase
VEIAIFGTSADPPTLAHLTILSYLSSHYDLVAVYASNNPFKQHGSNLEQRTQMLKLLIEDLQLTTTNVQLTPEISDRYSLNTVAKAREKWGKQDQFTIVIGTDLANQIFSWYQAEKLWRQVKILLIPRQSYILDKSVINRITEITPDLKIADMMIPPFSSTDYRQNHNPHILTDKVKAYIEQQGLYLDDRDNHQ